MRIIIISAIFVFGQTISLHAFEPPESIAQCFGKLAQRLGNERDEFNVEMQRFKLFTDELWSLVKPDRPDKKPTPEAIKEFISLPPIQGAKPLKRDLSYLLIVENGRLKLKSNIGLPRQGERLVPTTLKSMQGKKHLAIATMELVNLINEQIVPLLTAEQTNNFCNRLNECYGNGATFFSVASYSGLLNEDEQPTDHLVKLYSDSLNNSANEVIALLSLLGKLYCKKNQESEPSSIQRSETADKPTEETASATTEEKQAAAFEFFSALYQRSFSDVQHYNTQIGRLKQNGKTPYNEHCVLVLERMLKNNSEFLEETKFILGCLKLPLVPSRGNSSNKRGKGKAINKSPREKIWNFAFNLDYPHLMLNESIKLSKIEIEKRRTKILAECGLAPANDTEECEEEPVSVTIGDTEETNPNEPAEIAPEPDLTPEPDPVPGPSITPEEETADVNNNNSYQPKLGKSKLNKSITAPTTTAKPVLTPRMFARKDQEFIDALISGKGKITWNEFLHFAQSSKGLQGRVAITNGSHGVITLPDNTKIHIWRPHGHGKDNNLPKAWRALLEDSLRNAGFLQ